MLTNIQVKNLKPDTKSYRVFDSRGLYLQIAKNGSKYWRFKYRFEKKEKLLALGMYPEVTLQEARAQRDAARKLISQKIDPSVHKKSNHSHINSFQNIADEWFETKKKAWSDSHAKNLYGRMKIHLLPYLGYYPIQEITPNVLLDTIRRIESRGANETAHRILQIASQIFRYAVITCRIQVNPAETLKGALEPVRKNHLAAIIDPEGAANLMKSLHAYNATHSIESALKLSPLFFVRPGELRHAKWSEIDFKKAEWNIPAEKMKMKEPHLVPLCKQAIKILSDLKLHNGNSEYVFSCPRSKERPISNNSVAAALRRMGYSKDEMTAHGFRAMARTMLDEILRFRPDIIEHQLAHTVRDPLGRAYNRTKHLDERRKMMQSWADYLYKISGLSE